MNWQRCGDIENASFPGLQRGPDLSVMTGFAGICTRQTNDICIRRGSSLNRAESGRIMRVSLTAAPSAQQILSQIGKVCDTFPHTFAYRRHH
jgi:hypothetical protein